MDIKSLATQVMMQQFGGKTDASVAQSALDDLTGGDDGFDLGRLVSLFTTSGGDVADKAKSWLGDGANEQISAEQLKSIIGDDKVAAFATKLGIGNQEAGNSLSELLPTLIDKSSRGGNLLDSVGGLSGLRGLASKFFK